MIDHSLLPLTKKAAPDLEFSTSNDIRAHQVHLTDPSKMALVSTSLPSTKENALVEFLREHWKIFA
jgi:hypothetical protein